jgi:hypothetical protein
VDNNPLVLTHAAARLCGAWPGTTAVIEADLRAPGTILDHPALRGALNLDEPVGLMLGFVVHFLADHEHPNEQIKTLMGPLAPGSALLLSHATAEEQPELAHAAAEHYQSAGSPITLRTPAAIAALFDGLELYEPGVVAQPWWRPDSAPTEDPSLNWAYGGVGVKHRQASEPCNPTNPERTVSRDDESAEGGRIYDEHQLGRQLALALDALATHPLAPAPGENSYLRIPPDPPLHTMRASLDRAAMSQRTPRNRGSSSRQALPPSISSTDDG